MWVDGRSLASHYCTVADPSQLCNRFLAMQVVPVAYCAYILTFAFSLAIHLRRFSIFSILSEIKIQNSAIVQLPTDTAVQPVPLRPCAAHTVCRPCIYM